MKKVYLTLIALLAVISASAQGWPANYNGVMLQGFSWNAYEAAQWKALEAQTRVQRIHRPRMGSSERKMC